MKMNMNKKVNDITEGRTLSEWGDKKPTDVQVGGNHYTKQTVQPAELIQKLDLSWCKSNAIKYILRAGNKGSAKEDIQKAIHYLELELQIEKEV
jgi:hypothetical protein